MEKVIDLEDRIPSFRERRKRRTNFKFILLTTIFVLVLLFLLYLQSSYSKVQTIVIEGNELETQQFYIDESQIAIGDSMWAFAVKDVEATLQELNLVNDVKVKRKLLTGVTITVTEYEKVAYLNEGLQYYPMLENGYIYKEGSLDTPIDAPVFMHFTDEGLRKRLLKELPKIDHSILALISQINAIPTDNDPYAITLFMNDGYEVRADITTLADKIQYYPSIIAQIEGKEQSAKGVIDIEVGTYYQSFENEYGAMPITVGEEPTEESVVPVEETNDNQPIETESETENTPASEGV
jgi:cell division protein FtsQ